MASKKKILTEVNGIKIISDCGLGYLHANSKNKVRIVMVACADCKEERKVNYYSIKNSGAGKYCNTCSGKGDRNGCYIHGEGGTTSKSRTNTVWNGMKQRCSNTNDKDYDRYGGRGITVCDEWQDYVGFKAWADGRLEDAENSLERKDNNKGYNPDNVMIMPTRLQAYNRRNGMDLKKSIEFAKLYKKYGKITGYVLFYMNRLGLKDYQVKQFVLYSKHKDELAEMEL